MESKIKSPVKETIEEFISMENEIFELLKAHYPKKAIELEPYFKEYIKIKHQMSIADPTGNFSFSDIEKMIPGNLWIKFMKEFGRILNLESLKSKN